MGDEKGEGDVEEGLIVFVCMCPYYIWDTFVKCFVTLFHNHGFLSFFFNYVDVSGIVYEL